MINNPPVKLVITDEVNIKFENLPLDARKKLANTFKYTDPSAKFRPACRLGRWDGNVSLFGIGGVGYLPQLERILTILDNMGIEVSDIDDRRHHNDLNFAPVTETYWSDRGKVWPKGHVNEGDPIILRDYQVESINRFLENPQSLQEIATGAGKTMTTATLVHITEGIGRTITIVPNKSLVEQTEEDFINVGLDVGVYYGDRKELNRTHTICTWQSLNILDKKSKDIEYDQILTLTKFLHNVKTVIVDECHNIKVNILRKLLTQNLCNAPIRWGLTGTVPKEAYDYENIIISLGPVVGGIKAHELQEKGVLSNCHVNILQLLDIREFRTYADELKYLVTSPDRVQYICDRIKKIAETGNTLILVNRIDTGKQMIELLPDSVFISGAVKTSDRRDEYDEIRTSDNKIIVATYGVAAVGLNIPRIFNLVLLEPGKSFVRVIQSIGRGIRKAADKDHVEIWDITSTCKFAKRHLTERKKFYKEAKYNYNIEKVDWK